MMSSTSKFKNKKQQKQTEAAATNDPSSHIHATLTTARHDPLPSIESIQLVLAHYDGDISLTIESFKRGTADAIV